jgi:hypothetical protein
MLLAVPTVILVEHSTRVRHFEAKSMGLNARFGLFRTPCRRLLAGALRSMHAQAGYDLSHPVIPTDLSSGLAIAMLYGFVAGR